MFYVYLIESPAGDGQRYVGTTVELDRCIREHNAGKSSHAAQFAPWRLVTCVAFANRVKVESFERYLKPSFSYACGWKSYFQA
jgi:predicted GIY-YIG superfamily endonuclease